MVHLRSLFVESLIFVVLHLPCPLTSHHITSHHITSHHITSHYITLHYITSQESALFDGVAARHDCTDDTTSGRPAQRSGCSHRYLRMCMLVIVLVNLLFAWSSSLSTDEPSLSLTSKTPISDINDFSEVWEFSSTAQGVPEFVSVCFRLSEQHYRQGMCTVGTTYFYYPTSY